MESFDECLEWVRASAPGLTTEDSILSAAANWEALQGHITKPDVGATNSGALKFTWAYGRNILILMFYTTSVEYVIWTDDLKTGTIEELGQMFELAAKFNEVLPKELKKQWNKFQESANTFQSSVLNIASALEESAEEKSA